MNDNTKTNVAAILVVDTKSTNPDIHHVVLKEIWEDLCLFDERDSEGLDLYVAPRSGLLIDKNYQPVVYVTLAGNTTENVRTVWNEIRKLEFFLREKYTIVTSAITVDPVKE